MKGKKKELLAYFYCDQFGGTMAIKKTTSLIFIIRIN